MNTRAESPGRYERESTPESLIWIYCLVKGAWRDECYCECVCVSFVCVFMFKMGHVHLQGRRVETYSGDEGTTSMVAGELTCKATFIRQWR